LIPEHGGLEAVADRAGALTRALAKSSGA